MIPVFIEGSDGGMWALSPLTWDHIAVGNRETAGMWIRASDAVKLFQSGVAAGAATSATDWCGSESGTPHARVTFDTAASERAHEGNPLPCGSEDDESDFERRERIADEIGDRKHDQSRDNT